MKKLAIPLIVLLISGFFVVLGYLGTSNPVRPVLAQPPTVAVTTVIPPTATAPTTPTPTTPPPVIKYGGVLRWVTSIAPQTPIGWLPEAGNDSTFSMQLSLQSLLEEQADGSITPNLAVSWEISLDPANPAIIFHLKKGVKFQDGTDFNAQAAKWNLDQIKANQANASATRFWKSFDILDDYTIKVNLTSWQNWMLRAFADRVGLICSPTAFVKNGVDWMRWHMVGTGAFMQTGFQKDVSLITTRFPGYYEQGKPYLDGVQLLYVVDALTAQAIFKSGGADIIQTYSSKMASDLINGGYKIISQPTGATVLAPDSDNPDSPWSNPKVRMAAEYAIDKDAITKTFGYGFTQPAYQVNSSTSPAYDTSQIRRLFDVAKAKQLLTESGYPNGFKTRIIIPPGFDGNIPGALQSYLTKAGISCDLEFPSSSAYSGYVQNGWENGLLFNSITQYVNPNNGFYNYFGVTPPFTWCPSLKRPSGWTDIVTPTLASWTIDPVLARQAEAALYNDATVIPLYYDTSNTATNNNVRDSGLGTLGTATWWEPQQTWLGAPTPNGVDLLLQPSSQSVAESGNFTVTVQAQCGTLTVDGIDVYLDFDPAYLAVQSATPGTTLSTVVMPPVWDNTLGTFGFSAGQLGGQLPSGNFAVVSLNFLAKKTATNNTPVFFHTANPRITSADLAGNNITGKLAVGKYSIYLDTPLCLNPSSVGPVGSSQTFGIDIRTNVSDSQLVSGVQAYINFDATKLEVLQTLPGTTLPNIMQNTFNNALGLVSYSAGQLGAPYPSGNFTVSSIQFRAKTVTSNTTTAVTFVLSSTSPTSIVDFGGAAIRGTHSDAAVQIIPAVPSVNFSIGLQGGSRPDAGWVVPLTLKFFAPGTADELNGTPVYASTQNTTKSGSSAITQIYGINPGTYDITAASTHTLCNVKRSVVIGTGATYVDIGTLLEGDANSSGTINIQDFGILSVTFARTTGATGFDARADFDRNGSINIADFGLLASNYGKYSPVILPVAPPPTTTVPPPGVTTPPATRPTPTTVTISPTTTARPPTPTTTPPITTPLATTTSPPVATRPATPAAISPANLTLSANGTFTISVNVEQVKYLNSYQFDLEYDNSVIQVIGEQGGDGITQGLIGSTAVPVSMWAFQPVGSPGKIRVLGIFSDPRHTVSDQGYLAQVHFQVVGTSGSSSSLTLSQVKWYDSQVNETVCSVVNGAIKVQ